MATVVLLALTVLARPAGAVTPIVVNSVDDPGNGTCDATQCTLREAITAANTNTGADTINFSIPGGGVQTISPSSDLPVITDQLTIDGYTQPGASANTSATTDNAVLRVVLNGDNEGGLGLHIQGAGASNSVVKGLDIQHTGSGGVLVNDAFSLQPSGVKIQGNFIGTNVAGVVARPGYGGGIGVVANQALSMLIGGAAPAERNVISGNANGGVVVGPGTSVSIQGNFIGVAIDRSSALGNGLSGISISGGTAIVGGDSDDEANVIAFNGLGAPTNVQNDGVEVVGSSTGNSVLRNSIFSNKDLGIDLDGDGKTANDVKDPDVGPNALQNTPVLTKTITLSTTKIKGTLNSTPSSSFTVRFFWNPSTAKKQGKTFLGELTGVTTDAAGNKSLSFFSPFTLPAGDFVTATATDAGGNTSEFSKALKVAAAG